MTTQRLRREGAVTVQRIAVVMQPDHFGVEEGQHAAAGKTADGRRVVDDLARARRRGIHDLPEAHALTFVWRTEDGGYFLRHLQHLARMSDNVEELIILRLARYCERRGELLRR